MPPVHILMKPASGLCNLRCRYCFYHDVTENREVRSYGIMSLETLEAVINRAMQFAEREVTLAFQGGEPTLAGLDFFGAAVELAKKHNDKGLKVNWAIQTNGVGLGEDWAKFFKNNGFLVGLSLDGDKDTHDLHRKGADGKGTFNAVIKTAKLFNDYGVEYNILTVVNRETARRISSIYGFYKKMGFRYLQFIPCLDPLGEAFGKNPYSLTPEIYGRFLKTLFDLWEADIPQGNAPSIRDFDNYLQMAMGYPPESCGMGGVCAFQNVVEADGSVYPCDFYVLDELRLGNLLTDDFAEINKRREATGFVQQSVEKHEKCASCKHLPLCRGGCRRHREPLVDGKMSRNYFCSAFHDFFDHATPRLAEMARRLRAGAGMRG